jgi:hypothetical protein
MAEFKVILEGIELSEEVSKQIQSGIQSLVLEHLATIDTRGSEAATTFTVPRGFPIDGLVARRAHLGQLGEIGSSIKEITAREFGG